MSSLGGITPPGGRVLVVGGTGLLGAELVRQALARGSSVVATHHRSPAPDRGAAVWIKLDVTDEAATADALAPTRADIVVNAAYVGGGAELEAVTARAPAHLASLCAASGARFVHISSDVVFSGDRVEPYTEDDAPDPVHAYGRAKLAAERGCAASHPDALVIRTSLLYGGSVAGAQERLVNDPNTTFYTDEIRCPIAVGHLGEAVLDLAVRRDVAGVVHLVGDEPVDRLTLARLVAARQGIDPSTLAGAPAPPTPPRPRHLHLTSRRAASLLGRTIPGPSVVLG